MMHELTRTTFNALSKAELHIHLEGSFTTERMVALAADAHDHPWYGMQWHNLEPFRRTSTFPAFIDAFKNGYRLLRKAEHYQAVTEDLLARFEACGVIQAEVIYSPGVAWQMMDIPLEEIHRGIAAGLRHAGQLKVSFVCDTVINLGPEFMMRTLNAVLADAPDFLTGFSIGGGDPNLDMHTLLPLFHRASEAGLACRAHAGEVDSAANIATLLAETDVRRIAHACAAANDPELLQKMAQTNTAVDVCITSNIRTGAVKEQAAHPIVNFAKAGVPFSLATDDPFYFDTDLFTEYQKALHLLPDTDIHQLTQTSLTSMY